MYIYTVSWPIYSYSKLMQMYVVHYQESIKDCTLTKESRAPDGLVSHDDGDEYVRDSKVQPSKAMKELELMLEKREEQLKEQTKSVEEFKVCFVE